MITDSQKKEITDACDRAIALGHTLRAGVFNLSNINNIWIAGEECCPMAAVLNGRRVHRKYFMYDMVERMKISNETLWGFIDGIDGNPYLNRSEEALSWFEFGRFIREKYIVERMF